MQDVKKYICRTEQKRKSTIWMFLLEGSTVFWQEYNLPINFDCFLKVCLKFCHYFCNKVLVVFKKLWYNTEKLIFLLKGN